MMLFSERKKLAEKYEKWISENKQILDCPLTVISWLVSEGYLGKIKISELEKLIVESKNQIRGFQKSIEKRDKQIQGLNKGLSKTQKKSYKIKESKSQDIITIANQTEKERNLLQRIADLEAKLAESEKKYKNLFNTFKECQEADQKFKNEQYQEDLKLIDDLEKTENDVYKLRYELAGADETISQLKQQLKEKDKENNELVFIIEEMEQFVWEQLNNENFDKYKAYDEMFTKIKQLTRNSPYEKKGQDKISFTIEQLNLLYKTLTIEDVWRAMKKGWWLNNGQCLQLRQIIDNQIKQLKGKVEDVKD